MVTRGAGIAPVVPSVDVAALAYPTGAFRMLMTRPMISGSAVGPLSTGRLSMFGLPLKAGEVVTSISFMSGTTAGATLTHSWFSLWDSSRNKLAVSTDDTAAAWAANTVKTLALASPYTVVTSGVHYLGIVVVGTTMPSFQGNGSMGTTAGSLPPLLHGYSSTGLTDPASAPSTAAALTGQPGMILGWVS